MQKTLWRNVYAGLLVCAILFAHTLGLLHRQTHAFPAAQPHALALGAAPDGTPSQGVFERIAGVHQHASDCRLFDQLAAGDGCTLAAWVPPALVLASVLPRLAHDSAAQSCPSFLPSPRSTARPLTIANNCSAQGPQPSALHGFHFVKGIIHGCMQAASASLAYPQFLLQRNKLDNGCQHRPGFGGRRAAGILRKPRSPLPRSRLSPWWATHWAATR